MSKYIVKTFFLTVLLSVTTWSFGQNDTEIGYSSQASDDPPSITVTIVERGQNCPFSGAITSHWKWGKATFPYNSFWKEGTSASYSQPPTTVQLDAIPDPNPDGWYNAHQVTVTVIPTEHLEGKVSATVGYPFDPIEITPGPCNGNNQHYSETPNNPD